MLEVGWFSSKLLIKGKLLRNPGYFMRGVSIGTSVGLLVLAGLWHLSESLGLSVAGSGLVTGFIMPFLLKDVKMK
ncbi:MAG: hypothetical protein AAGA60_22080 [Cyanobacteria bacterium P01_E01_bin.42]